jgi:anti-sigma B factor antagonist
MCTIWLQQARGPDHPAACGAQGSGPRNLLTWCTHSHGNLVFVNLDGELDIASAPALAWRLAPLAETGCYLVLDLAGLRFCDCAGLSLFLRLRQRVISAGGSLHLTAATAPVCRLIAQTNLHHLLPVAADAVEVISVLDCDAATAAPPPRLLTTSARRAL